MKTIEINSDNYTMADFYGTSEEDLFAKAEPLKAFIDDWRRKGTYTYRRLIVSPCDNFVTVDGEVGSTGRRMIMLASNNYLGLNVRPEVKEAAMAAIRKYGTSMCGAPFLNGTYDLVRDLENRLAEFEQCEAAMVFTTGYQANVGTIAALMRPKDIVLIDRLCHASIVDGCHLAGCAFHSFRHNDMDHLERLLKNADKKHSGKLVVVDGVFSMDGDLAPLPEIVELAGRYGAKVMVDEAHGTGVLGEHGRGTVEHFGLKGKIDIVLGTFSKTLASTGGFIAASEQVVNYVRHYARSYIFSASPTPPNVAAALAALNILEREPELRTQLWENVRYFHNALKGRGFNVFPETPESAVMVIIVGADTKLRAASKAIHDAGVFVNTVVYPACGKDEARLRISLTSIHRREDLDRALDVRVKMGSIYELVNRQ
jgi:glycine C-acetyltransferase